MQSFEDPDAIFIRSLSYRSTDAHRVDTLVKQITELKKEANKREQEKKEMADVVEQDTLIELKGSLKVWSCTVIFANDVIRRSPTAPLA